MRREINGRVTKVFPDRFGVVKTIEVMTANCKHFVRGVRYVFPLEAHV